MSDKHEDTNNHDPHTIGEGFVGQEIDGYTLTKVLGEGAFGVVLACEKQGSKIVVKVATTSKSLDWDFTTMDAIANPKMGEARWSNAVRTHGTGKAKLKVKNSHGEEKTSLSFVLMENLPGNVCGAIPDDPQCIKLYLLQVLRGIYDFHQVGFLHRDLKPENIGGTEDLRHAVVYDLGLARSLWGKNGDFREPRTRPGIRGTSEWASLFSELGREQGIADDLYGWLYTIHEWANVESNTPQTWAYYEKWEDIRWFMKSALCPARVTYNNCPYGVFKANLYLRSMARRDIPDYFYIASLFYKGEQKNPQKLHRFHSNCMDLPVQWMKNEDLLFS